MEIIIYAKDGSQLASVTVASSSMLVTQIMSDNYLQIDFESGDYIDIKRDAYIIYEGVKYTLRRSVSVEKISTCEYKYTARFDAPQELLENIIMSHMAGENQIKTKSYERNFSIAGTAKEHLEMLWRNTSRLKINFLPVEDGDIDPSLTGVKVVAYNVVSCKSALQLIANAFECEWWVDGNETNGYKIHLGKCSFDEDAPTPIAYGFDKGVLPNAKRDLHKDSQRMTHICVQGGSQNINTLSQIEGMPKYGFSTLHLPKLSNERNGKATIYYDVRSNKFEGETGFSMTTAVMLTIDRDANTMTSSLFNEDEDMVVERAYDMSEFYPQKTRTTTAFGFQNNNTEFYVEDNGIEQACDYKKYQLGGEKITIVFQSGALAGKTFDVINYDHARKRFECAITDYDTISMPSVEEEMWRPNINDTFIVYGTALPLTYFSDMSTDPYSGAEWDMCRRCASILCENFEDKFAYAITLDGKWMSVKTSDERNKLKAGYWMHYTDNQLCGGGIDIRITGMKKYLSRPLELELTIGDEVKTYSVAQKLQQVQSSVSATYNYVTQVQEQTQKEIEQVAKGADGKDAGFGNVTASVDNNTGTPSVIVTTSGDNTAKNFNFEFHNLKGATGQAGKDGANGTDGRDGRDGRDGKDGTSVTILGSYNSLADLQREHPTGSLGDSYIIGTDLYVWYGSQWVNVGQIKGEDGKDGKDGINGKDGVNGKDGKDGIDGSFYIDTVIGDNPSNERVPSTKLFVDQLRLMATDTVPFIVNGKLWDYYTKSEINTKLGDYVTSSDLSADYYNKPYLNVMLKALQDSIPTKTSQLTNDSNFATETWVTNKGYVTSTTLATKLEEKENKRTWKVSQTNVDVGYQEILRFTQPLEAYREYSIVVRITGIHNTARFSNVVLLTGTHEAQNFGKPAVFEIVEGGSIFCDYRLYLLASNTVALTFKRTARYAEYKIEMIACEGYFISYVQLTNGDIHSSEDAYFAKSKRNYALLSDIPTSVSNLNNDAGYVNTNTLATELAKKEGKHDYILMYYDYRKQYSVQYSSGFTNVEVISELSINIYPAGCTNKNEMRAYLLNHQIQMKQMKRNASNDTIEVKYDAIYRYTVTDSYIQIGINGSMILSPVASGEIVYYQLCFPKMRYE